MVFTEAVPPAMFQAAPAAPSNSLSRAPSQRYLSQADPRDPRDPDRQGKAMTLNPNDGRNHVEIMQKSCRHHVEIR